MFSKNGSRTDTAAIAEALTGGQQVDLSTPRGRMTFVASMMGMVETTATWLMFLDDHYQLIGEKHYIGDPEERPYGPTVTTAMAMKDAVYHGARKLIVCQNRPEGPDVVKDDITFARILCQGGVILDIEVVDYLVFGVSLRSLANQGDMPGEVMLDAQGFVKLRVRTGRARGPTPT